MLSIIKVLPRHFIWLDNFVSCNILFTYWCSAWATGGLIWPKMLCQGQNGPECLAQNGQILHRHLKTYIFFFYNQDTKHVTKSVEDRSHIINVASSKRPAASHFPGTPWWVVPLTGRLTDATSVLISNALSLVKYRQWDHETWSFLHELWMIRGTERMCSVSFPKFDCQPNSVEMLFLLFRAKRVFICSR